MLGVVALVLAVVCKRMQRLPTMLGQQCWELSRWCWQWCANGCNNSQQCWDLQCIRGRIQPISLWKPSVMRVRGPNNVGRAVQTDPTLLRYASVIAEQKKCLESLAQSLIACESIRFSFALRRWGRFARRKPPQRCRANNFAQQLPTTCNRMCKQTTMLGVVGQQCCVLLHGA